MISVFFKYIKAMEKLEAYYIAGGSRKWCSEKQFSGPLKS